MKLNPKNFTKKQWIIAIAALVLVLAIIGGLLWFFLFSDPGKNVIVKKRRRIIVPAPETSDVSDPSEDPGGTAPGMEPTPSWSISSIRCGIRCLTCSATRRAARRT